MGVQPRGHMFNILLIVFASILSALFGWAGGRGEEWAKEHRLPSWMFESWVRDWLIGPLCAITAWILGVHSWLLILMIGLTGGALSTYWDFLFKFDNFWFHGFMIGMAAFPIAIVTGHWVLFIVRSFLLALWMGGWSAIWKDAHIEESGRYIIIPATLGMIC